MVIAEDWSSDCRRDLPYLARLAEAGGFELRIFLRDAETMHRQGLPEAGSHLNADLVREYANEKNGQQFATVPVAVFFTRDFAELYRYIEYPAIYHKDLVLGALRKARPGENEEQTKARGGREIATLLESPFFDVWARAGVAEIVSALHERLVTAWLAGRRARVASWSSRSSARPRGRRARGPARRRGGAAPPGSTAPRSTSPCRTARRP